MPSNVATSRQIGFMSQKSLFVFLWIVIFLLGLYFRMSGLFRGLGEINGYTFHPDEAKQVMALFNFLNDIYVRYYGSLFYDGYPYGLNHLDEYLLRSIIPFLGVDSPEMAYLYYYARVLRVIYGMTTLVVAYKVVLNIAGNKRCALLAMFILAISPMSITVAHFATGDIGVDLFTALCLLFLMFYINKKKHNPAWLLACGLSVGAAFSAKYNGALLGIVPGLLLCFEFVQGRNVRSFFLKCFTLLFGCLAGVLLFTPNILLDFETTISNISANFVFIKNYNVPVEILAKPWLEKATLGVKQNTLFVISSIGYAVCVAFVAVFILLIKKYSNSLRSGTLADDSRITLLLSVSLFLLFALFLSLVGKYTVQPFHFSYMQLPLVVVVCCGLCPVISAPRITVARVSVIILILFAVLEFGQSALKDNFFWRLEDNQLYKDYLSASIYTAEATKSSRQGNIRSLLIEPGGMSVFRNRYQDVVGPDAPFWNSLGVAPLPQVPNPTGRDWIFVNGPSFPRNERMIALHGGSHGNLVKRYLVIPVGMDSPAFGLRSGSYATKITIKYGGVETVLQLEAQQQRIVTLTPEKWMTSRTARKKKNEVLIIPLEVSVPHDDIWFTILTTQKEKEYFTLFGGNAGGSAPEEIATELKDHYFRVLKKIRYMETSILRTISPGEHLLLWEMVLPAGSYKLYCTIKGITDKSSVILAIRDAKGGEHIFKNEYAIHNGVQEIEFEFTKPFFPYQSHLVIYGITGTSMITYFSLTPDYHRMDGDFDKWRAEGIKPEWVSKERE